MPAIPADPNLARRKIYFHKVFARDGDPEFTLDRTALMGAIHALSGTTDFHLDEGDEQYLCAVGDQDAAPQRFRFYRVRRRNLPETEEAGAFEELDLDPERGLAESIHVVLFDEDVIGSEYNHYGPRISLLPTFLRERCDHDLRLKQLVRRDVIDAILNMQDIRLLRLKVEPGPAAALQNRQSGLGGGFDAAEVFSAGKYMDLTLSSESDDAGFTQKVKAFFNDLRGDGPDEVGQLLETAQVYGRSEEGALEWFDVLKERVVLSREIERESPRHRALDKDAAYAAIIEAHAQVKAELDAGTIVAEP
jgi:hypothetical protein